ncbi:MAG: YkvA family protein [Bauldia sp.]
MREIKYGEILGPEKGTRSEARVRRGFWPALRKALARIPFAEDLVAAYFCAFDPATPPRVKGVLLGALAYFIVPIDAIPDFFAGLGFTDDLTVLVAAIAMVGGAIGPDHREAARRVLADTGGEELPPASGRRSG